jgi:hypothetical protein
MIHALAVVLPLLQPVHDIYTGVHGRNGQLCCGADDCFRTMWRERGDNFEFFLPRERVWTRVNRDRITFLPIPGDNYSPIDGDQQHYGHICYVPWHGGTYPNPNLSEDGLWSIYCAFIPPGAT